MPQAQPSLSSPCLKPMPQAQPILKPMPQAHAKPMPQAHTSSPSPSSMFQAQALLPSLISNPCLLCSRVFFDTFRVVFWHLFSCFWEDLGFCFSTHLRFIRPQFPSHNAAKQWLQYWSWLRGPPPRSEDCGFPQSWTPSPQIAGL